MMLRLSLSVLQEHRLADFDRRHDVRLGWNGGPASGIRNDDRGIRRWLLSRIARLIPVPVLRAGIVAIALTMAIKDNVILIIISTLKKICVGCSAPFTFTIISATRVP